MPTAIALKSIIDQLEASSNDELVELTGLSERQVERCKVILAFPEKYRQMSMDPDPKKRIPSNFWVELHPVLELTSRVLPDFLEQEGRGGVIDRLVQKYQDKKNSPASFTSDESWKLMRCRKSWGTSRRSQIDLESTY